MYVKINGKDKVYDLSNGELDYQEHEDGTWSAEAFLSDVETHNFRTSPVIVWEVKPKDVKKMKVKE